MPEPNLPPVETQDVTASRETAGRSLLAKLGAALLVVAVVAGECLIACLYLPSATETEALASASLRSTSTPKPTAHQEEKPTGEQDPKEESSDLVEVDLGDFTVTATHPTANTTLRMALRLYGTVSTLQHDEFTVRMKEIQHRFREQVIVTLRSAELTDLTDAGLGLLKRTILEKTNALLGKPLLKMIVFSEFSLVEL